MMVGAAFGNHPFQQQQIKLNTLWRDSPCEEQVNITNTSGLPNLCMAGKKYYEEEMVPIVSFLCFRLHQVMPHVSN